MTYLKYHARGVLYWYPGTQKIKLVLQQIKSDTSLEAKVTKPKLSYFGHIVRRQFFARDNNADKMEGGRKRERPNIKWINFAKKP